jgi:Family of unknown function (DUF6479)
MDSMASTAISNASRYTCSETVTFPVGSSVNQSQTVPYMAMSTDLFWANSPDPNCYQRILISSDAPTTTSPLSPPSLAAPPTTRDRVNSPSKPTIVEPPLPATNAVEPASTTNDWTNNIPIWLLAGVAVVALLVAVVWQSRRQRRQRPAARRPTQSKRPDASLPLAPDASGTGHETSANESHAQLSDLWSGGGEHSQNEASGIELGPTDESASSGKRGRRGRKKSASVRSNLFEF